MKDGPSHIRRIGGGHGTRDTRRDKLGFLNIDISLRQAWTTMESKLPDELTHEILRYNLTCPPPDPGGMSGRQFAVHKKGSGNDTLNTMPSPSALLVCKRWLRVGTPLFYQTVLLRTKAAVQQLHSTLQANPALAKFVRNVRLHGGYGKDLHGVLAYFHDICWLSVQLEMPSKDSNAGLLRALPHLNPTCLRLNIDWQRKQKPLATQTAILSAMPQWTRLVSLSTSCAQRVHADDVRQLSISKRCASRTSLISRS